MTYRHSPYERFVVHDPKQRIIHKATVRDRVVHTLVARRLEKIYQIIFIARSYSCQINKGTHRALRAVVADCRRQSHNYTQNFWYLKGDIKKFFDNVNHQTLIKILRRKIKDEKFIWLINKILESFYVDAPGVGLPLGNFTSQWLGNIYLNELDYFVKQKLRIKNYVRYADDFIILGGCREWLVEILFEISRYLSGELKLSLHPDKILLNKFNGGVEWLGYKILPHHVILKKQTKSRMLERLGIGRAGLNNDAVVSQKYQAVVNSYLGQLKHCAGFKLSDQIIFNNFIYDYAGKIF